MTPTPPPRGPLRPWITFAGCVLLVVVLDWAESLLLPIAVALLLTFLLNTPVSFLSRFVRRGVAVVVVVLLTFMTLTVLSWVLAQQVASLAAELPNHRENIRRKVLDIRRTVEGGPVEKMQETIEGIKKDIERAEDQKPSAEKPRAPTPVVVREDPGLDFGLPIWMTSLVAPAGMAGLVSVLVIFMLLEQRDMRDRLIALLGIGNLASATKAFDEATLRISRYLLMQSLVNAIYGLLVGIGLWWFGVPYPVLWAALGALLRFVPYVGPWIAAGAPILLSVAALPDWTTTLWVVVMFVALELFTNMVLETVLYAGAAGVTQTALIIAMAFWTWLWGPIGLILATPLTSCLVVLGKHVRGLSPVAVLISDDPIVTPEARFYQRLLAKEAADAKEIAEEALQEQSRARVFEQLLRPAFKLLERDRAEGRLTDEEAAEVRQIAEEIARDIGADVIPPSPYPRPTIVKDVKS